MKQILIIQGTAFCHVSLAMRLIYDVARSYPDYRFTYLVQPETTTILVSPPENLEMMAITAHHNRFWGRTYWHLVRLLQKYPLNMLIDLENTFSSNFLSFCLTFGGKIRKFTIRKPTIESKNERMLFKDRRIAFRSAPMHLSLMKECFERAGIPPMNGMPPIDLDKRYIELPGSLPTLPQFPILLGFAPFGRRNNPSSEEISRADYMLSRIADAVPHAAFVLFLSEGTLYTPPLKEDRYSYLPNNILFSTELAVIRQFLLLIAVDSFYLFEANLIGTEYILLPNLYRLDNQGIKIHTDTIISKIKTLEETAS